MGREAGPHLPPNPPSSTARLPPTSPTRPLAAVFARPLALSLSLFLIFFFFFLSSPQSLPPNPPSSTPRPPPISPTSPTRPLAYSLACWLAGSPPRLLLRVAASWSDIAELSDSTPLVEIEHNVILVP
uniref:Uncharacterized protein n=1 Tax=Ananas comosus var. bracteatus TaxID=296719 RepID=A0A6V7P1G7_ANACO|nr:unnamed protein product [Ananas comosus var. bracteatus]